MKRLVLITFLLISCFAKSQTMSVASGYTFCDWDLITYTTTYTPKETDTAIVFISVREYFPGKEFYLNYNLDTSKTLHCFSIYFSGNKWTCVPRKNMEEVFSFAPNKEKAVVYVEGNGKTFPGSVDRATRLTRTYNVLTIYFDWPTRDPDLSQGKNYRLTRSFSKPTAKPFANFMTELSQLKKEKKVAYQSLTLFMHSMGNILMKTAVQKKYFDNKDTLFTSVILNAACVPQRRHKKWVEQLVSEKGIYIMRNNNDKTLNGAKLITFHRQLGERPRGPYANNALYIDLSAVLGEEHNYFLFTYMLKRFPEIHKIYATIFDGKVPVFDDEKKFRKQPDKHAVQLIAPEPKERRDLGISIMAH